MPETAQLISHRGSLSLGRSYRLLSTVWSWRLSSSTMFMRRAQSLFTSRPLREPSVRFALWVWCSFPGMKWASCWRGTSSTVDMSFGAISPAIRCLWSCRSSPWLRTRAALPPQCASHTYDLGSHALDSRLGRFAPSSTWLSISSRALCWWRWSLLLYPGMLVLMAFRDLRNCTHRETMEVIEEY